MKLKWASSYNFLHYAPSHSGVYYIELYDEQWIVRLHCYTSVGGVKIYLGISDELGAAKEIAQKDYDQTGEKCKWEVRHEGNCWINSCCHGEWDITKKGGKVVNSYIFCPDCGKRVEYT